MALKIRKEPKQIVIELDADGNVISAQRTVREVVTDGDEEISVRSKIEDVPVEDIAKIPGMENAADARSNNRQRTSEAQNAKAAADLADRITQLEAENERLKKANDSLAAETDRIAKGGQEREAEAIKARFGRVVEEAENKKRGVVSGQKNH